MSALKSKALKPLLVKLILNVKHSFALGRSDWKNRGYDHADNRCNIIDCLFPLYSNGCKFAMGRLKGTDNPQHKTYKYLNFSAISDDLKNIFLENIYSASKYPNLTLTIKAASLILRTLNS